MRTYNYNGFSALNNAVGGQVHGLSGIVNVTEGDEASLTDASASFPTISIAIDASSDDFQL